MREKKEREKCEEKSRIDVTVEMTEKRLFFGKFFDKKDTFKNSKKSIKLGNFFIEKIHS